MKWFTPGWSSAARIQTIKASLVPRDITPVTAALEKRSRPSREKVQRVDGKGHPRYARRLNLALRCCHWPHSVGIQLGNFVTSNCG
jgi:hypothetical protein